MARRNRSVKVFLSSTFQDFILERHLLVTQVFPELRRRCRVRQVDLVEVDLRWGITAEQAERGEVLPICLGEIDRCRPFFVGMLGDRYGWVPPPDMYDAALLADQPWLQEHVGGRSVTELEILHGVLNNRAMADRAYFYFRDPAASAAIGGNRNASDPLSQQRLLDLKDRIRHSGFPVVEDYPSPDVLADHVLQDLWRAIDDAFPLAEVPDAFERQDNEHEAFAESRRIAYIPSQDAWSALDPVLDDEAQAVRVVLGASGGGKTARLAAWWQHLHDAGRLPAFAFVHYIGGTPESATLSNVLERLLQAIRRHGATRDDVPSGLLERVGVLPGFLDALAAAGGGLIVLDALNQFADAHDGTLWWLPAALPDGVRLVVSTLQGPAQKALEARGWLDPERVVAVAPLTASERLELIDSYLCRFTKQIERPLAERLANHPRCANPLYLRVVLEEIRQRASHEALGTMLDDLLGSPDLPALFVKVLKHLEHEHDRQRAHLVRQAMGFLAVARRGLTEVELLELLSDADRPSQQPMPRAFWSPLLLALEASLVSRDGQLGFFHDHLRQAVVREYLDEDWERQAVHGRLGDIAMAWRDEQRFSASLRTYALQAGVFHLLQADRLDDALLLFLDADFREASILASGSMQGLIDDGTAVASRLLMADPDPLAQRKAWHVLGLTATEPERLRRANPEQLDASARRGEWAAVAARAGLAADEAQRLLLACRGVMAAPGNVAAELQAAADHWARMLPVTHAGVRLWNRLRSDRDSAGAQVRQGDGHGHP